MGFLFMITYGKKSIIIRNPRIIPDLGPLLLWTSTIAISADLGPLLLWRGWAIFASILPVSRPFHSDTGLMFAFYIPLWRLQ